MTDKTKMSNLESYTELSIQIATLDMKLDAILKLLNKPEITYDLSTIVLDYKNKCDKITPSCFEGPCDCTIKRSIPTDEEFTESYK